MLQSIKEFFASWLQSLRIFAPAHGKLFFLVTLKTIIETYGILIKKFWWLFLLCVGTDIVYKTYAFTPTLYQAIGIIWFLAWCLLGFVTFLTIRPSISLKNYQYYGDHGMYYGYFVLFTMISRFAWPVIVLMLKPVFEWSLIGSIIIKFFALPFLVAPFSLIPTIYASPFLMVLIFFSLDISLNFFAQLQIVYRSIKMVFYNYPFFIIIGMVSTASWLLMRNMLFSSLKYALLFSIDANILYIVSNDLAKLILPIFFCFVSNFYIKQVHEQFKRYFDAK